MNPETSEVYKTTTIKDVTNELIDYRDRLTHLRFNDSFLHNLYSDNIIDPLETFISAERYSRVNFYYPDFIKKKETFSKVGGEYINSLIRFNDSRKIF